MNNAAPLLPADTTELTFGQRAVGKTFNPSGSTEIEMCKNLFASVIDQMHNLRETSADAEVKRMASIAINHAQTAQMWAVKAITWKA